MSKNKDKYYLKTIISALRKSHQINYKSKRICRNLWQSLIKTPVCVRAFIPAVAYSQS